MENQTQKNFEMPHGPSYYLFSFILAFLIVFGIAAIFLFVPDFIFHTKWFAKDNYSFWMAFNENFYTNGNVGQKVAASIYWLCFLLTLCWTTLAIFLAIRQICIISTTKKWWHNYISASELIINSCDASTFTDKVALVICTCNDIVPNTILQTSKQTYKNLDVWVSDDSSKPEVIQQLDSFCAEHGFHVLHRDPVHKKQHPTKIGNLYYFIEKYGDNYDFIMVNDSSSIVTPNFVENSLCFFHSPLLDHSRDAALACNGCFYGHQNLISRLYSLSSQFPDFVNGPLQTIGHPTLLSGWCSFYRTSIFKTIPLETIECPSDDTASGYWLTARGYVNYTNPFDFSAKLCPQSMEGIKNQWLKWTGADVFMWRTGLSLANYPNKKVKLLIWVGEISKIIVIPAGFVVAVVMAIISGCLDFFYFNFSNVIMIIVYVLIFVIIWATVLIKNHVDIKFILFLLFYGLVGAAIVYKKAFQTVKCLITHEWSSGAVTVKGTQKSTTKQKFKMCRFDGLILLLTLALCSTLSALSACGIIGLSQFIIWFVFLFTFGGPSILYLIFIWIGEIPTKKGWDESQVTYDFWLKDFKYKHISETETWKKQHQ